MRVICLMLFVFALAAAGCKKDPAEAYADEQVAKAKQMRPVSEAEEKMIRAAAKAQFEFKQKAEDWMNRSPEEAQRQAAEDMEKARERIERAKSRL